MTSHSAVHLAVLLAAASIVGAIPVDAHHSHGNYSDAFVDIEGVVKEVHFVNPHSWIYIEVKGPNGQPQKWSLEASSVIQLERIGVTREYIKAGDTIKARCHPLRDGSRGCLLGFVKAMDGSVKD